MPANEYHMVSHWRAIGTPQEVYDLIIHGEDLPRWWPAAFTDSLLLDPGDASGTGTIVRLESRGWLPYRLHWHVRSEALDPPHGFTTAVWGDFNGRGVWTFEADGAWVDVTFDWRIAVHKPLVRYLSPIVKPLFAFNHRWAMARGEESLRLELARRHAATAAERDALAAPPRAPRTATQLLGAGAIVLGALLVRRRR